MNKKCTICNKAVTKKSPAITCSRCEAIVHERAECSGLNNKQRAALHAADALEWVCSDCHQTSRRTSFLSAGDDEEVEDTVADAVDIQQIIDRINKEVNKIVMRELAAVMKSANYACDKVDEFEKSLAETKDTIKNLERKQVALKNQNINLETRVGALEQRLEIMEQAALSDQIEIAGVPFQDNENVLKIVSEVGRLLQVADTGDNQVRAARRLPARKDRAGVILVQLKDESCRSQWIQAGRSAGLEASSLLPNLNAAAGAEKIYVREALTGHLKYLLGKAKTDLKATNKFKFVWSRYGKIFVRKSENSKIYWIKCVDDITKLAA
ncbi:hypothetical protein NE865_09497 [Phthorimaea operculella]|nr:hypothetical protein NE865_09497 [Phthorimaea operculella]